MKVKGYYNIHNGVFLGPVTARDDKGNAHTPRYVDGVCFGEYDTDTDEFVPMTNPMIIPKGEVMTFDEDIESGKTIVTGVVEDKGLDLVSKKIKPVINRNSYYTPNVHTTLEKDSAPIDEVRSPKLIVSDIDSQMKDIKATTPVPQTNKPKINLDSLF